ncbi:MAG: DUF3540 domain-containing protein [Betaproteobacteria bacterium]|jgi:hypothetical protein
MNMIMASPVFMTEEILTEASEGMTGAPVWKTQRGDAVHKAFSLIMEPAVGDTVLVARSEGKGHILSILEREDVGQCDYNFHGDSSRLFADSFTVESKKSLELFSHREIGVCAPSGNITMTSRNLVLTALDTLSNSARVLTQNVNEYLHKALGISIFSSKNHYASASDTMKLDAERIDLG